MFDWRPLLHGNGLAHARILWIAWCVRVKGGGLLKPLFVGGQTDHVDIPHPIGPIEGLSLVTVLAPVGEQL